MMQLQRFVPLAALLLAATVVVSADGNCKPDQCKTPKHYHEIGCTPIHDDGSCCPTRFDCSSLSGRDLKKCYYNGVAYDVDKELSGNVTGPCSVGCRCNEEDGRAQLTCVNVECPELFQGPLTDQNCYRTYSFNECCSTSTQCSSNSTNTPVECNYQGKTYKEGQVIYPDDAPCKKCICQPGFNGTLNGPWCQEISCGIELHYSRQISDGCSPIYYGDSGCCPIDWRCPAASDAVVKSIKPATKNAEHKCKFGNLELQVGDKLSPTSNKCVECSCNVPPLVSCRQRTYNECSN